MLFSLRCLLSAGLNFRTKRSHLLKNEHPSNKSGRFDQLLIPEKAQMYYLLCNQYINLCFSHYRLFCTNRHVNDRHFPTRSLNLFLNCAMSPLLYISTYTIPPFSGALNKTSVVVSYSKCKHITFDNSGSVHNLSNHG